MNDTLGAHPAGHGTRFAVWAPRADAVSVIGEFNGWEPWRHRLEQLADGVWEGFVPEARAGALYKYRIAARGNEYDKADPFAFATEAPPGTASRIWDLGYAWQASEWMAGRRARNHPEAAIAIYEVHAGSWRRVPEEGARPLTYRELAGCLPGYARETGFTHVEFLPLVEHPFYGSWGYQASGFFAPTSRYGTPQDLMGLVDALHRDGLGVILDWAPSHFAGGEHGLAEFDGDLLYERPGESQWQSPVFDFGRREVRDFLIASAAFWLEQYHADGLRVDAVAEMLDRDGVGFLRELTGALHTAHPGVLLIAEESSAWPGVTRPTHLGGLGFDLKWDMGWMHDTLEYLTRDPVHRKYEQAKLTFRPIYAWDEKFVLPLSHDEVKPGFGSLLAKMPGDTWRKFANLRLLLSYMYAQPGKKLLFMGGEFAQWSEWQHEQSLDWHLLESPEHCRIRDLVGTLNWLYRSEPALGWDNDPAGFEWVDFADSERSTLSFLRKGRGGEPVLAVFNFTPEVHTNYRVGAPRGGLWREILNTDAGQYGGSGRGNFGEVEAAPVPWHNQRHSLNLTLPPLAGVYLKPGD